MGAHASSLLPERVTKTDLVGAGAAFDEAAFDAAAADATKGQETTTDATVAKAQVLAHCGTRGLLEEGAVLALNLTACDAARSAPPRVAVAIPATPASSSPRPASLAALLDGAEASYPAFRSLSPTAARGPAIAAIAPKEAVRQRGADGRALRTLDDVYKVARDCAPAFAKLCESLAAAPAPRRAGAIPQTESRRRRGWDVDIPWRHRVAARRTFDAPGRPRTSPEFRRDHARAARKRSRAGAAEKPRRRDGQGARKVRRPRGFFAGSRRAPGAERSRNAQVRRRRRARPRYRAGPRETRGRGSNRGCCGSD